jgi:hypothetical protein
LEQFLTLVDRIATAHIELFTSHIHIGSRTTVAPTVDRRQPPPFAPLPGRVDVPAELIRARAHQRYRQRGHQPGDAIDDWHRTEIELLASRGGTIS